MDLMICAHRYTKLCRLVMIIEVGDVCLCMSYFVQNTYAVPVLLFMEERLFSI